MSRSLFLRQNKDLFLFKFADKNNTLSIPLDDVVKGSSKYSNFLIKDHGKARNLYFISDDGRLVLESSVNRNQPHNLLLEYSRLMFASHIFNPEQNRAAIVGLGGGAMVHFLNHFAPAQKLDIIEIDPMIVDCADKYFNVRSNINSNIIIQDAFKYFDNCDKKYDTIYFDAFLKPVNYNSNGVEVDSTGIPSFVKTQKFLKNIQKNLTQNGFVIFNLHSHNLLNKDIDIIRSAFPHIYSFPGAVSGNYIVAATPFNHVSNKRLLANNARKLDDKRLANFSFIDLLLLCEQY
jgi:spermidine synthase